MKRSNILFLFFFFYLGSSILYSQTKIGFQLGLNFANASYSPLKDGYVTAPVEGKTGFLGGILAEFKLNEMFYFQPEINYVPRGVDWRPLVDEYSGTQINGTEGLITLDYIDIPLLLKAKFGEDQFKPYLFAGPNIGLLQKAEVELHQLNSQYNSTVDAKDQYTTNFALDIGGGIEYAINPKLDIFANIKYSLGLNNILSGTSADSYEFKSNGLQILVGLKFCLFGCEEEKEVIYQRPITKTEPIPLKKERHVIKEYDLGKYDVPFFVSGYYRPNIQKNLDNIYILRKDVLKDANYIENFPKGSDIYNQYKLWANSVENIFNVIYISSVDEIFPMFKSQAGPDEFLEISVYGYADPRPINGKYVEAETVKFVDLNDAPQTINKGDNMDNLKLSGLRAYYTGLYLHEVFMEAAKKGKTEFSDFLNSGKVVFRFVGAGVPGDESSAEAQRRVKIIYTRLSK